MTWYQIKFLDEIIEERNRLHIKRVLKAQKEKEFWERSSND